MIHVDIKYIHQIGARLPMFKKKGDYLFNFRCPKCGDSRKKQSKARGYFYRKENSMNFRCHNCGASCSFRNLLKEIDSSMYKEYCLEVFGAPKKFVEKVYTPEKVDVRQILERRKFDSYGTKLSDLPSSHEAREFVAARKIPEHCFERLYFVEDISVLAELNKKYSDSLRQESRLAIPFFDEKGSLIGLTLRGMRGESLRYIAMKIDDDAELIFGLDVVNKNKTVYIVEGPIDSLFLTNAIAVGGSALGKIDLSEYKDPILVFDNEPRNKEIVSLMEKQIDLGNKICLWPETIKEKDINDMILSGIDRLEIEAIIHNNTFSGLEAKMKFTTWKKC